MICKTQKNHKGFWRYGRESCAKCQRIARKNSDWWGAGRKFKMKSFRLPPAPLFLKCGLAPRWILVVEPTVVARRVTGAKTHYDPSGRGRGMVRADVTKRFRLKMADSRASGPAAPGARSGVDGCMSREAAPRMASAKLAPFSQTD